MTSRLTAKPYPNHCLARGVYLGPNRPPGWAPHRGRPPIPCSPSSVTCLHRGHEIFVPRAMSCEATPHRGKEIRHTDGTEFGKPKLVSPMLDLQTQRPPRIHKSDPSIESRHSSFGIATDSIESTVSQYSGSSANHNLVFIGDGEGHVTLAGGNDRGDFQKLRTAP